MNFFTIIKNFAIIMIFTLLIIFINFIIIIKFLISIKFKAYFIFNCFLTPLVLMGYMAIINVIFNYLYLNHHLNQNYLIMDYKVRIFLFIICFFISMAL